MEEIAEVYARALFLVARDQDRLDTIKDQLCVFTTALNDYSQLRVFLFSPYFSTEEKKKGLNQAIVDADPTVINFFELLLEKHRMPAIFRIERRYQKLWESHHKLLPVDITSAIELDQVTIDRISEQIESQTKRRVQVKAQVSPDILGGIIVRVGNSILDASIRHRLEQFRKQVARAG